MELQTIPHTIQTVNKFEKNENNKLIGSVENFHTPCRNCAFAIYRDAPDAIPLQTGCALGRIEAFKNIDANSVVEAYDDTAEFYIINGRICNAFRHKESKWTKEETDLVEKVRKELKLKLAFIVPLTSNYFKSDLERTLKDIRNQVHSPHQVFIVNGSNNVKDHDINGLAWDILGNKVTWRIIKVIKKELNREELIDLAVPKVEASYYTVLIPGQPTPKNFVESIHKALNEEMQRFSLLEGVNGHCETVQTALHSHPSVSGNYPMKVEKEEDFTLEDVCCAQLPEPKLITLNNIVDKIKYLDKDSGYLIRRATEICPNLKSL